MLECLPPVVAEALTKELSIPTIGIGAGPHCSGQVTPLMLCCAVLCCAVARCAVLHVEHNKRVKSLLRAAISACSASGAGVP